MKRIIVSSIALLCLQDKILAQDDAATDSGTTDTGADSGTTDTGVDSGTTDTGTDSG